MREDLADGTAGAYYDPMMGDSGDWMLEGDVGLEAEAGNPISTARNGSAGLAAELRLAALGVASLIAPPAKPAGWGGGGRGPRMQAAAFYADSLPGAAPMSGRGRRVAPSNGAERFRSVFQSGLPSGLPSAMLFFLPILRRWFDLDERDMAAILARVEAGQSWIDAPFPGVGYFHFQGGPGAAARECGCLLVSPGALFPHHLHHGRERSLVLQGSLLLDGVARLVGEVIEARAGSMHDFVAGPGEDLILIVAHDGLSFSV